MPTRHLHVLTVGTKVFFVPCLAKLISKESFINCEYHNNITKYNCRGGGYQDGFLKDPFMITFLDQFRLIQIHQLHFHTQEPSLIVCINSYFQEL